MYNSFQLGIKYLKYYFSASNGKGHGSHSPFIFHFITKVLNDKQNYPAYSSIECIREKLLRDDTMLMITDYGAGSATLSTNKRSVSAIVKNAAKPKKYGQILFRMVKMYQPDNIVELGTSLGMTTAYLAMANSSAYVETLEGSDSIAAVAQKNIDELKIKNVKITKGNFDDTLGNVLAKLPKVDMVFIDGNHRHDPTLRYFDQLISKSTNDTILIFDDIHWSEEMERAWSTICKHPDVRCTIDLFFIGIVLFRKEFKEKQDFVVRF